METAKGFIISLFLLTYANQIFAQIDTLFSSRDTVSLDTTFIEEKTNGTKSKNIVTAFSFAVPSALITYGVITRATPQLQKFDHNIDIEVNQMIHRKYKFDDIGLAM